MFRGFLRPGQGFRSFVVLRKKSGVTESGTPFTGKLMPDGEIIGIISQASQREVEQHKQSGHPITHTIVQRGTENRAKATEVLNLKGTNRQFLIQDVADPGELGHFTVYHAEERVDLQ